MFTGIIESTGIIEKIEKEKSNLHFYIKSNLTKELYIDQSISHNGVCLTVVEINEEMYKITAVHETLLLTTMQYLEVGQYLNLERAMLASKRLDGHFVQGHVDSITKCVHVEDMDGSWYFTFLIPMGKTQLIVNKGSIAINGVSLTAILEEGQDQTFKVAIIPYTYDHTNFKYLQSGQNVNIEFDILGKYVERMMNM